MAVTTLKALHAYLRLLDNSFELKKRIQASSNQRSMKEALAEICKLADLDNAVFRDPLNIAAMIGSQRFVMIWGEPSVTAHVARVFDSAKVLLTVLIEPAHYAGAAQSGSSSGSAHHQTGPKPSSAPWASPKVESSSGPAPLDIPLESLKPVLAGNLTLTCRLFRVLFEHMMGFASQSSAQQGSAALVNELTSSKEHGRCFLAMAMFILGAEIDRENVMSFMMAHGLFGIPNFEQLLQNREYCDAYYTFRKLNRAFVSSPVEEEAQLRNRVDKFNAKLGGKPSGTKLFEAEDRDKARIDAHLAAFDLIEAMALTPWSLCLNNSIAAVSSISVLSLKHIASHFECFADGEETKEQANREIADHLLAFARQFSADSNGSAGP